MSTANLAVEPLPVAALAVGVAFVLEAVFQEPPAKVHPVVWLGRAVETIDRSWRRPRIVGTLVAVLYPLAGASVCYLVVAGTWRLAPAVGVLSASAVLFASTSFRMLLAEVSAVIDACADDPDAARERLPALAGREPAELSPGQLRSAAVESAAENLADGLVAPLFAFALFAPASLALGAAAAWWVKAVNTLDSMLGYRSKAVGTPSARLDDAVMWVPARLSALLLSIAAVSPRSLAVARPLATNPPSPNSGWPMGVLAGALRVRLEKPGVYELEGGPRLPDPERAKRGVAVVRRAGLLAYGLAALAGVIAWL